MTFEYALSPLTRLGSLPDPRETASNLSPKADSALKLSDTAYPGGPPRASFDEEIMNIHENSEL